MTSPVWTLRINIRPSEEPRRSLFRYVSGWHTAVGRKPGGRTYSRTGRVGSEGAEAEEEEESDAESESEDESESESASAGAWVAPAIFLRRVPSRWSTASLPTSHARTRPASQKE